MLATVPPTENALATRTAVLDLARAKLAPLHPTADDCAALPAWLWSLPTHAIARSLKLDAAMFAVEIAGRLDAETAHRHPADRFVAYLATHHPHLSHGQRARLAELTQAVAEIRRNTLDGEVTQARMARRGFSPDECERYGKAADALLVALFSEAETPVAFDNRAPLDKLRTAGERAHVRRAFAEGDLEISPATAAKVLPPQAAAPGALPGPEAAK